jgi:hypothetical protein
MRTIQEQLRYAVRVARIQAEARELVSALAEAVRDGDDELAETLARNLRGVLRA